ncbi:MAG: Endolytic murein transglycosylase [Patescibacteria group bacterium]|nr:Endolytic murein transglycosylase [Patescibacteria group bacterium]
MDPINNTPAKEASTFLAKIDRLTGYLFTRIIPNHRNIAITICAVAIVLLFGTYISFFSAPKDFPIKEFIEIEKGASIQTAAEALKEKQVIKSVTAMKMMYKLGLGDGDNVIAGEYFFEAKLPLWTVVWRVSRGNLGVEYIRVTIPEGLTLAQMGKLLEKKLPNFNRGRYTLLTRGQEGFLFPDTYFFAPTATEDDVVEEMRQNFEDKIDPFRKDVGISGRSLEEIITMASIIEKEGITSESRRVISGILWKRIEAGMKLQVDAVFPYIFGKNTFDLTRKDLQFDSPYNTYRYEGLPPGPIASPSIDSIEAALYPEMSPYWFYLSDMRSQMHYARTYDEHLKYKNKYLP